MVSPVTEAFARIKRDLGGNLTKFVHEKLGYPAGTDITKYLAGEQIDAVAAAIWNFERGGALIVGDQTDEATLARGFDYVQQIGKTPIVVNDSRGFYTSHAQEVLTA